MILVARLIYAENFLVILAMTAREGSCQKKEIPLAEAEFLMLTVERNNADDEADGEHEDDDGVDLEAGRLVGVEPCHCELAYQGVPCIQNTP